jgi:type VI protein secretion system component Hcp
MAGEIDAFLYFGAALSGTKAPKLEGETTDVVEKQSVGDYGRSMAITGYDMGFKLEADWTEESPNQNQKDKQAHDPEINDITVNRVVDAASPMLLLALWNAARYEDAWIVQKKAGGAKGKSGSYFWEIHLREVAITNVNWSAEAGGATTEKLTLKCRGVEVYYYKQKHTGELESSPIGGDPLPEDLDIRPKKKDGDNSKKLDSGDVQRIVGEVLKIIKKSNPKLVING